MVYQSARDWALSLGGGQHPTRIPFFWLGGSGRQPQQPSTNPTSARATSCSLLSSSQCVPSWGHHRGLPKSQEDGLRSWRKVWPRSVTTVPCKMPGGLAYPQGTAGKLRHGARQGHAGCRAGTGGGGSGASSEPRGCLSPIMLRRRCPCHGTWGLCCPLGLYLRGLQRQLPPPGPPPAAGKQAGSCSGKLSGQGGWRRWGCARAACPCHHLPHRCHVTGRLWGLGTSR